MNRRLISSDFPYLPIVARIGGIVIYQGQALIDTGFDGGIILPRGFLPDSGFAAMNIRASLADGSETHMPAYRCSIELEGFEPLDTYAAALGGETLIGLQVISRFFVVLDRGRQVVIEP